MTNAESCVRVVRQFPRLGISVHSWLFVVSLADEIRNRSPIFSIANRPTNLY